MIPALALSFLSGLIALSYEILWYRAFSFQSGGEARTFSLLLGAYLGGLAAGALGVGGLCRRDRSGGPDPRAALFWLVVSATVIGFWVVPLEAWCSTKGWRWTSGLGAVGVAAAALGGIFPLVSHSWIAPDLRVGQRVAALYLANILGSTAGSLLTGFVLLDGLGLGGTHVLLGFLGLGMSLLVLALAPRPGRLLRGILLLALAGLLVLLGSRPFDGVYEKLQLGAGDDARVRFAHVIETRSGVITVNRRGQVFGGGIYDGAFNTSLTDDLNAIIRCYALSELHRAPRDVLMIGLGSGSWASVVSRRRGLEHLTIVEINPGYLKLIPQYPEVAGVLTDPKVQVEIDDGRRWLVRNPHRTFDLIVANTSFHWRASATNLLSREFLELVRAHLRPGGVYYYNTTGSDRVSKTGATVFPHALRVMHFLAVSDAPLHLDPERFREELFDYPRGAGTVLDRSSPADRQRAREAVDALVREVEPREPLLRRVERAGELVTDDNMGTEWEFKR